MSGDDYKFQASLKYGPGGIGMLNVRANTEEEFEAAIADAVASVGPLAVLTEAFNTEFASVSAVAAAFPGTQVVSNYGQPAQQPAQQGSTQQCQHGQMLWKEGPAGDWKGWFCPAQKTDPTKCKPRYIK